MKTFTLHFMVQDDVLRHLMADDIMTAALDDFGEQIIGIVAENHLGDIGVD